MSKAAMGQDTTTTFQNKVHLSQWYLGSKVDSKIHKKDLKAFNSVSIQSGLMLSYTLAPQTNIKTYGTVIVQGQEKISNVTSFEVAHKVYSRLSVHFGVLSTPTTELRPHPTTWQSQAETATQKNILGGSTGAKLRYKLSDAWQLSYGWFAPNEVPAHHIQLKSKWLVAAGYIEGTTSFVALVVKSNSLELHNTYASDAEMASSVFYNLKKGYTLVLDASYASKSNVWSNQSIELRKQIDLSEYNLTGFLGIEIDVKKEVVSGRFLIHL